MWNIGQRLETIVNMLFCTRHCFENGDITEPIYQRRMLRLQLEWREIWQREVAYVLRPDTAAPYC